MNDNKFLIHFFERMTKKDLFIAVWLLGGALFAYLFLNYQKKSNQRNFRSTSGNENSGSLTVKQKSSAGERRDPKNLT